MIQAIACLAIELLLKNPQKDLRLCVSQTKDWPSVNSEVKTHQVLGFHTSTGEESCWSLHVGACFEWE